jgi:hypothetical protein
MALFVNFVAIFPKEQWMVAAKGCSLSAGRAVSLLVALLLLKSHLSCFSRWSLTPAAKTNLFTKIYVLKNNNLLEKSLINKKTLFTMEKSSTILTYTFG